jgi:hypothetical protein
MTTEPRRFRVILDTCDIVPTVTEREKWPESVAPSHSIFDQRHLSEHRTLDIKGRIRKPKESEPKKQVQHRVPAPTEPCSICNGSGRVGELHGNMIVGVNICGRCKGTGEQMKFTEPKPKKTKVYPYRRIQEHKSQGDPCALCNQSAAEHRPDRARMKKEREER